MNCVETAQSSILWNGEPLESTHHRCGLRQGDPLSSYLFILCMERLSYMIDQEVHHGNWDPIVIGRSGPSLSHMFFADDIIITAKNTPKSALTIKTTLDKFCKASGLKINLSKSKVFFAPKTPRDIKRDMTDILQIGPTNRLGKYLGVNVLHSRNSSDNFRDLVEKVQRRLSSWKAKNLNLAARTTLIQSVTTAIPTYTMHSCWIPTKICNQLDKLNRTFLWGSDESTKKVHLVGWDRVIKSKSQGGLGIRETRKANMAMLAKMGWRVFNKAQGPLLEQQYDGKNCNIKVILQQSIGVDDTGNFKSQNE
ncbi:hypothetical protein BUALT_Bualt03G0225300 [Buddleja alternifolia]|uniref:Reverse transcriptase domain-containing protein n=1 Tax=Buddleja alternifolia TaxID=168488 RepID=A0AAV6Y0A4_9LAMI|nr:hypothetical protein BUALT_Bualt03G0225300 [Buddleja alternifolia]